MCACTSVLYFRNKILTVFLKKCSQNKAENSTHGLDSMTKWLNLKNLTCANSTLMPVGLVKNRINLKMLQHEGPTAFN